MAGDHVELLESVTISRVEYAYGLARDMQLRREQSFADCGMRAARAGDVKLLKVLEKATEMIHKLAEEQRGETKRAAAMTGGRYADNAEFTELGLWKGAYTSMDKGAPLQNFEWIYGAAAWLCGYYYR